MIQLPVVKNCPVTRGSIGRISIPPALLGEIAGATQTERDCEWLILLKGERSEGGLDVRVTGIEVPARQSRTGGDVDLPQMDLPGDVVGVLHSHHTLGLGAMFSGTDLTELNPRFGVSIVVSALLEEVESQLLGFSYSAEGRVTLPCGNLGVVQFKIEPQDVKVWPYPVEPSMDVYIGDKGGRGDCPSLQVRENGDPLVEVVTPSCELCAGQARYREERAKQRVFGGGSGLIVGQLPAPAKFYTREVKEVKRRPTPNYRIGNLVSEATWADEEPRWLREGLLKGWSEAGSIQEGSEIDLENKLRLQVMKMYDGYDEVDVDVDAEVVLAEDGSGGWVQVWEWRSFDGVDYLVSEGGKRGVD